MDEGWICVSFGMVRHIFWYRGSLYTSKLTLSMKARIIKTCHKGYDRKLQHTTLDTFQQINHDTTFEHINVYIKNNSYLKRNSPFLGLTTPTPTTHCPLGTLNEQTSSHICLGKLGTPPQLFPVPPPAASLSPPCDDMTSL